jgi:hypothetical protein
MAIPAKEMGPLLAKDLDAIIREIEIEKYKEEQM